MYVFLFITVICFLFRGTWHGQVAIKMLHMDPDSDNNQAQLSAFKLEVRDPDTITLVNGTCRLQ